MRRMRTRGASSLGGARLPKGRRFHQKEPVDTIGLIGWPNKRADLSDIAFRSKLGTYDLLATSEPWPNAGPRLGALIGLTHSVFGVRRFLLVKPAVFREPRPTKLGSHQPTFLESPLR